MRPSPPINPSCMNNSNSNGNSNGNSNSKPDLFDQTIAECNGYSSQACESSSQSQSQSQFMTQNELTQMAGDDTDSLLFSPASQQKQQQSGAAAAIAAIALPNPREISWGRLIGESSNGNGNNGNDNGNYNGNNGNGNNGNGGNTNCSNGPFELVPRDAAIDTRSTRSSTSTTLSSIQVLGCLQVCTSDKFNVYKLGRNSKMDIVPPKPASASAATTTTTTATTNTTNTTSTACRSTINVNPSSSSSTQQQHQQQQKEQQRIKDGTKKIYEWAHSMVSNHHCSIYCMLSANSNNNYSSVDVFCEDSSGNGTIINGTTLLKRGERRLLHTGDEICLVNSNPLQKKIRNPQLLQQIQRRYTYIFINAIHQNRQLQQQQQQQQQQQLFAMASAKRPRRMVPPSSSSSSKRVRSSAIVNVRNLVNHSLERIALPNNNNNNHKNNNNNNNNNASTAKPTTTTTTDQSNNNNNNNTTTTTDNRRVEQYYDIRDTLGTGTCGEVKRAICRKTGREFAIKIIPLAKQQHLLLSSAGNNNNNNNQSADNLAALQAEASILKTLKHPYIVQLSDVFFHTDSTILYLVMELMPGGDLFDRIVQKSRYTEVESRRTLRRLLNAIYYLHEVKSLVHRDLKPENILCVSRTNDVDVKLTDFGLAKNVTNEGLKTFCGTPQYFAPEVLRRNYTIAGKGRYGKEADMWSLGVILYILLSGTPPFDASSHLMDLGGAISFPDPQWHGISQAARDLVLSLLTTDPADRLSVQQACDHAWLQCHDGDSHTHPLDDPNAPMRTAQTNEEQPLLSSSSPLETINEKGAKFLTVNESLVVVSESSAISSPVIGKDGVVVGDEVTAAAAAASSPAVKKSMVSPSTAADVASSVSDCRNNKNDRTAVTVAAVTSSNGTAMQEEWTSPQAPPQPQQTPPPLLKLADTHHSLESPTIVAAFKVTNDNAASPARDSADDQLISVSSTQVTPLPDHLNDRSNRFREIVERSAEKELASPQGMEKEKKLTAIPILAMTAITPRNNKRSKKKSMDNDPNDDDATKPIITTTTTTELTDDEICSQFSDESRSSFSDGTTASSITNKQHNQQDVGGQLLEGDRSGSTSSASTKGASDDELLADNNKENANAVAPPIDTKVSAITTPPKRTPADDKANPIAGSGSKQTTLSSWFQK